MELSRHQVRSIHPNHSMETKATAEMCEYFNQTVCVCVCARARARVRARKRLIDAVTAFLRCVCLCAPTCSLTCCVQGKCAFGPDCRKAHDPHLLSDTAISALRGRDADSRQQLTLHLASIPEGVEEQDIMKVPLCKTCTRIAPCCHGVKRRATTWCCSGSRPSACGEQEFSRFGVVQSVNVCRKPSLVASEQYWRYSHGGAHRFVFWCL